MSVPSVSTKSDPHGARRILVPAYDDQILWNGHASMITEIRSKLDFIPDVIFCSGSRGGLLGGVIAGCGDAGWDHGRPISQWSCASLGLTKKLVPIVTIEPLGYNCFYSTMALNEPWKEMHGEEVRGVATDMEIVEKEDGLRIARLRKSNTRVATLGPASPTLKVVHRAMMRMGGVTCVCVPDEMMMGAAISFTGNEAPLSHLQCNH
jgi:L-serine/L-threonine ammonia-lyase